MSGAYASQNHATLIHSPELQVMSPWFVHTALVYSNITVHPASFPTFEKRVLFVASDLMAAQTPPKLLVTWSTPVDTLQTLSWRGKNKQHNHLHSQVDHLLHSPCVPVSSS